MLIEQEAAYRKEARGRFIASLWADKPSDQLLSLAAEASLTVAVAEELYTKVEQAKEQVKHVNQMSRLRKEAAAADSHLDKVNSHAEAEIARLEAQVQEASFAASDARKAFYAAEDSAKKLLALYYEGALPASELPKEVAFLIERDKAEAMYNAADQLARAAKDERDRRHKFVCNIEHRMATMPIMAPLDMRRHENMLKDNLKEARQGLDEAESKFKKAHALAEAARKAIPESH